MDIMKFVEAAKPLGLLGVKVSARGADTQWVLEDECRRNIYSATKSFTSCAVGIALREGLISLEEKLTDAFAEDIPERPDENLRKATVRDLMTMCLGQAEGTLMGAQRPLYAEDDWVKLALRVPFVYAPGTRFVYNNVGPYLAGVLVQRRAGCDLVNYLAPRLFSPLGVKRPTWETDPLGRTFGAGGLFLTMSEMHKFGQLYLARGVWNGRRILDAAWVEESAKPQSDAGYGYLFWRGEYNSFRADGKYSQITMILPGRDAVVTTVAECRRGKEFLDALYTHVCARL